MKPALCLDLDDIIYPFMETLVPFHNKRFGTDLSIDDYWTFRFEDVWKLSADDTTSVIDECFQELEDKPEALTPLNGADLAMEVLVAKYRLFIVTARPDEFHTRTTNWLNHHFPGVFEGLYLCNSYMTDGRGTVRTKASVVEELDAVGLVDDSASHIKEVVEHGRVGILFGDYSWSRDHELPSQTLRAANWTEVTDLLQDSPISKETR